MVYWLPVIIWALVMLFVSVSRGEAVAAVSGGIPFSSAIAHFGEFLVLGFLVTRALAQEGTSGKKIFFSVILCFAYSTLTEILQIYVPGRFFAYEDILMNNVGTLVGVSAIQAQVYLNQACHTITPIKNGANPEKSQ
ncbi:MAG: VanZ family protein [Candidatus Aenigmarchaeota archaeon]|nr:VanZ family protein [Candidatus Aenigmarchaeota archaeon]MCK5333350.1 VanZ family protein [Candidatus Aenigmarchaeota archaeon]